MKVCHVVSVFPRFADDTEVPWLRQTLIRQRRRGMDAVVFAPSFRGCRSHEIDSVPVYRFRYFFKNFETLTHDEGAPNKIHKFHYKIITVSYILSGILHLIRFHRKERFDILHVHWPFPHGLLGVAARFFTPAKIVLTFYGADLLLMRRFGFVKAFLDWFIRTADAVIAISSFTAAEVKTIRDCTVDIIPYGTTISARRPDSDTVENGKMVLAVGRMIERKGFRYLVEAAPMIHEAHPDAHIWIVGGGPLLSDLNEFVNRSGCADYVHLPGKVSSERLEQFFAGCSIFVSPAIVDSNGDTEGLGVVIIEALSYRKPVVASNVGGIGDVVIDGETGLLVKQKEPRELADAVSSLLDTPPRGAALAQRGFDHVSHTFSWERIIDRMSTVYDTVAHR
jgi:glycosyltransferase involved in cell wall biosynthesis